MKRMFNFYLPLMMAVILYGLIYLIRYQQGGLDLEVNIFEAQREILDQRIRLFLPSPQSELLSGILLGEKYNLPGQLRLALRDTSTLHIVVVSGQNLTLLAGLAMRLSGLLTRKITITLALLIVASYTLLTGADIPVVRAAIMATLAYLAQILGRETAGVWVLALTAAGLLLINPQWLFDLSFQLSFLATLGLITIAPLISKSLTQLPSFLRENLAVTIGAQAMVTPIIASNFHQFSIVGILANLLVIWIVPYIMVGGLIMLVFSFISQLGGQILGLSLNLLLTYFIYIVQFFASLPFAWEYIGEFSWLVWIGYYLIITAILLTISKLKIQIKNAKLWYD